MVDDPKKAHSTLREPILKCGGPCQNIYHKECARQKGLIVPGSVKEIPQKTKGKAAAAQLEESKDAPRSVSVRGGGDGGGADENEEE